VEPLPSPLIPSAAPQSHAEPMSVLPPSTTDSTSSTMTTTYVGRARTTRGNALRRPRSLLTTRRVLLFSRPSLLANLDRLATLRPQSHMVSRLRPDPEPPPPCNQY
jgi:hypothetical protein